MDTALATINDLARSGFDWSTGQQGLMGQVLGVTLNSVRPGAILMLDLDRAPGVKWLCLVDNDGDHFSSLFPRDVPDFPFPRMLELCARFGDPVDTGWHVDGTRLVRQARYRIGATDILVSSGNITAFRAGTVKTHSLPRALWSFLRRRVRLRRH